MAYTKNILPKSAAYYSLSNASIHGSDLILEEGGFAEISISHQMLPKLTSKMLAVIHPSIFSDYYTNDAVQVSISVVLTDGTHLDYLISASETSSGVFNTELDFPELEFVSFVYRITSTVPVIIYNWELCYEESVDVTTIIDGVEQALPRLLYDYNTYAYAVSQKEVTVGLITCYLLSATDLQGHFTLAFFATERCDIHVRVKDNGITELFSPQVYTVEKGYASISIPHAYLKKHATDHVFSVTLQCTNGQLSIPVRGLLYTIDGGYLATRLLDAGVDVQDISIKQLNTDISPSEIYAIGFEGNRLILKSREYSNLQNANWKAIKDFGEGLLAGVEFSGKWLNRNNENKYTIETEVTPHVFIVETDRTLVNYYGNDFDTKEILDDNVTALSVCQGFNSMYDITQDQGLVVVYIKNGNVYYRQKLYNASINTYGWYSATLLYDGGDATFVNVHRLSDYRLGICIQHSGGTKWYITGRTYVSQSTKTEVVQPYIEDISICTVMHVDKVDFVEEIRSAVLNEFDTDLTEFNGFGMTFDCPLVFLKGKSINDLKNSMIVYINSEVMPDIIKEVTLSSDAHTIFVILKENIIGGKTVTIKYNMPYLVGIIYNKCYTYINSMYTWNLPSPMITYDYKESIPVNTSVKEFRLDVVPLKTISTSYVDKVNAVTQGSLNCVVTPLGKYNMQCDNEIVNASMEATLSVTVSLVGYSPI